MSEEIDLSDLLPRYDEFVRDLTENYDGEPVIAAHAVVMAQLLASAAVQLRMSASEVVSEWMILADEIGERLYELVEINSAGSSAIN